jgi:hypothetical protein
MLNIVLSDSQLAFLIATHSINDSIVCHKSSMRLSASYLSNMDLIKFELKGDFNYVLNRGVNAKLTLLVSSPYI